MGYIPPSQGGGFYPTSFTSNRPVSRQPKTDVSATGGVVGKRPLHGLTSDTVSFTNTPPLFAGQPQFKASDATRSQVFDISKLDLHAAGDKLHSGTFLGLATGNFNFQF